MISAHASSNMARFNASLLLGLLCSQLTLILAATVTHDFNITWVTANPDGAFSRPTIGINGKWPIPRIDANKGDRVVINVNNQLGNQSTSLHFHGLFMNNSQTHMDGPSMVTQCPIPPGQSFTYNFTVSLARGSMIACSKAHARADGRDRLTSRGPTGITPTPKASIPMGSEDLSSSMTQTRLTRTNTMRSWS